MRRVNKSELEKKRFNAQTIHMGNVIVTCSCLKIKICKNIRMLKRERFVFPEKIYFKEAMHIRAPNGN